MINSSLFSPAGDSTKEMVKPSPIDWSRVLGQEKVKALLQRAILSDRLHKAYLFYGPEGVGKDALAIELSKTINCRSTDHIPCHACDRCRHIGSLMHPDIKFIFAAPKDFEEKNDVEYINHLQMKAQDPYRDSAYLSTASILIKQIRDLKKIANLKLYNANYRIFILSEAERMTEEAANSLLKLLEEPPERLILILTSSHLDRLLPTIVSRCQIVKFSPLNKEEIRAKLIAGGVEPQRATVAANLSMGSFRKAKALVEEDYHFLRQHAWELLMAAPSQDVVAQLNLIAELSAGKDRGAVKEILLLALLWLRDLQIFQLNQTDTAAVTYLHNGDQLELIKKLSQQYTGINLEKTICETEHTIDLVEKNIYIQLVLVNFLTNLKKAGV